MKPPEAAENAVKSGSMNLRAALAGVFTLLAPLVSFGADASVSEWVWDEWQKTQAWVSWTHKQIADVSLSRDETTPARVDELKQELWAAAERFRTTLSVCEEYGKQFGQSNYCGDELKQFKEELNEWKPAVSLPMKVEKKIIKDLDWILKQAGNGVER